MSAHVALVTGSGRGLGLSIAGALLESGWSVGLLDSVADRVPRAVDSLKGKGRVLGQVGDITRPEDVDRVIAETEGSLGPVDLLVNNAAVSPGDVTRAEEIDIANWRRQIDVNVTGTLLMSQRVARSMIAGGRGGAIVNISSIYAVRAVDWRLYAPDGGERFDESPYHVSKAAIDQMTRSLAVSWAEYGIRVNSVNPGPIDNQGTRESLGQDAIDAIAARVPMRRLATEREIADAVLFLASPQASYITGTNLIVDGGWTCL